MIRSRLPDPPRNLGPHLGDLHRRALRLASETAYGSDLLAIAADALDAVAGQGFAPALPHAEAAEARVLAATLRAAMPRFAGAAARDPGLPPRLTRIAFAGHLNACRAQLIQRLGHELTGQLLNALRIWVAPPRGDEPARASELLDQLRAFRVPLDFAVIADAVQQAPPNPQVQVLRVLAEAGALA